MTMLDDERLRASLRDAAASVDLPTDGPERILEAARAGTADATGRTALSSLPRPSMPRGVRGRVALAAALVAGAGGRRGRTGRFHRRVPARPDGEWTGGRPAVTPQRGCGGTSESPGSDWAAAAPPRDPGVPANLRIVWVGVEATVTPGTSPPPLPTGAVGQPPKVETTGSVNLSIASGSLNTVVTHLTDLTTGAGGFVARSQLQVGAPGAGSSYGQLVLQVPQAQFGALLDQVQKAAKVTSVSSTSTDVTGQYVDLQARITALEASRQQYLTILAQATSISDILSVQSQLDTIQSQIEELQGQLNLLDSQTTYATLTVSLSESGKPPPPPPGPRSGLSAAWSSAVGGFVAGVEWLIRIAGRTLFVLLVALALVLLSLGWAGGNTGAARSSPEGPVVGCIPVRGRPVLRSVGATACARHGFRSIV